MKAEDLRIGNLILYKEIVSTVIKISNDNSCYVRFNKTPLQIIEESVLFGWSGNESAPIPLTEEWLLKFGFINQDDEIDYSEFELNGLVINGNGSDAQEPFHFMHERNGLVTAVEINYVHQLQNLYFALTGCELTIK